LDFELEMAAVVGGPPNPIGQAMTLQQAKDRVFGFMLMNDWSARDIQKWEYVPLGPFTSKNFATTVSPWIVMAIALDKHMAPTSAGVQNDPVPLPYLQDDSYGSYDVSLTVAIQTKTQKEPIVVSRSNFTNMYWNAAQQLVHHSVTGCSMKAGDMLGSGTISGSEPDSFGSMLELSWNGTKEVIVGEERRKFLEDGDSIIMSGACSKNKNGKIGFGECEGLILPVVEEASAPEMEKEEARYTDLKLYGYWRSSSTWRVRVALSAKGLSYVTIPIDITKGEHKTVEFLYMNPLGQVPVLECMDSVTGRRVTLTQSVAIIEFLDKAFPDSRQLFPVDHFDRVTALEMVEAVNAGIQPLQNVFFLRPFEVKSGGTILSEEEAKRANEYGLLALETLVKKRLDSYKGSFCMGTFSPTVADACMVPQMYNARRFGVDVDRICPKLVEIECLCLKHPWFVASHPQVQPDAIHSQ
jgi:fumarylacetoacetase